MLCMVGKMNDKFIISEQLLLCNYIPSTTNATGRVSDCPNTVDIVISTVCRPGSKRLLSMTKLEEPE